VAAIVSAARALHSHSQPGRLHLVSFCRAGRHRFVAVASLLERLLAVFTAWGSWTEHLASHEWPYRTRNLCNSCLYPTGSNKEDGLRARRLAELSFRWAFADAADEPPGH